MAGFEPATPPLPKQDELVNYYYLLKFTNIKNYLIKLSSSDMQYNLKLLMFMILVATTLRNNIQAEKHQKPSFISLGTHYSSLDSPKDASDAAQNIFTDLGAWFGFALPDNDKSNNDFGFIGPYLMHYKYGAWLSQSIINLDIKINSQSIIIDEEKAINSYFNEGKLHFNKKINGLEIDQTLQYISANSALIHTSILSDTEITANLHWLGELLIQGAKYEKRKVSTFKRYKKS